MDHLLGAIYETRTRDSTLARSRFTTKLILQIGAVDGTRTRNNQIGNLGLCQLNYYRIYGVPWEARTPDPVINGHEYETCTHISINGILLVLIHEVTCSTI